MNSLDRSNDLDQSYSEYQRSLRERTADSWRDLNQDFASRPSVSPTQRRRSGRSRTRSPQPGSVSPTAWGSGLPTEHADHTYDGAASSLRSMLHKHEQLVVEPKTVQFTPRSMAQPSGVPPYYYPPQATGMNSGTLPRGEIPTPEEVVPLLQNQSGLLQQLEAENAYVKGEVSSLKAKIREVVEENRVLHEELKATVVQEILHQGVDVPGVQASAVADSSLLLPADGAAGKPVGRQDLGRRQIELERISTLHAAKSSRLEAQLAHTKEELEKAERDRENLQSRLRLQEAYSTTDPELMGLAAGLCIRCGQNEAVLPPSSAAVTKVSIDKVTRERDELVEQITVLKGRYADVKQREEAAYQQVKSSVQMVEQAELEQMQALVQQEQLKEQLNNMHTRMEDHTDAMQKRMAEERQLVRWENEEERTQLNAKIKEMSETNVELQSQLERVTRDKVATLAELQTARGHIDIADVDYGKATDSMKVGMTHATLERNTAVQRMGSLKREMEQLEKDREQERSRLHTELEALRRRLYQAEKELVESKEESIQLTNTNQALERETHLARLAKESIEKNRSDDVKALQKRAEAREAELTLMVDNLQNKHENTRSELEDLVKCQSSLIQRLRGECRRMTSQLENTTIKYKNENRKLKASNEAMRSRLGETLRRCAETEEQVTQQASLQGKMRDRLQQMDSHAQHGSEQVLALLARESSLMRDRQLLAREVEFLRSQLTSTAVSEQDKMWMSRTQAIEDIMASVNRQQQDADWDRLRETQQDIRMKENGLLIGEDKDEEEKEQDETEQVENMAKKNVMWMDSGRSEMWEEAEPE